MSRGRDDSSGWKMLRPQGKNQEPFQPCMIRPKTMVLSPEHKGEIWVR